MPTKIIAPIKFSETSDKVSNLQSALLLLLPILGITDFEIPAAEIEEKNAGDGTVKGILILREKYPDGYNPELLVDERMAKLINDLLERLFIVKGRLTDADNQAMAEHTIVIAEYDLEGVSEFDKKISNHDGAFGFSFNYKDFQKGDGNTNPDLTFRIFSPAEQELQVGDIYILSNETENAVPRLADSLEAPIVLMNVPKEITIRIVPAYRETRITEFERLVALLFPFIRERHFADLKEDDKNFQISFLSKESGVEKSKIEILKHAFAEERGHGIAAWAFFELANLPLPVTEWNNKTPAALAEVLDPLQPHASDENLIELAKKLQAYGQEKNIEQEVFKLQEVSGKLVNSILHSDEKTQRFFDHYARHEGDIEAFWKKMEEIDEFIEQVPEIQLTLQLSQLTLGNTGLVDSLKEKGIKDTKELVSFSHEDWKSIIQLHPAGIPTHVEAETEDEKANIYATELKTLIEVVFPTEVIKQQSNSDELKTFLNHNTKFDFSQHAVDHYIKSPGMVWPEGVNKEILVKDLQQTQRLYSITASAADSHTLASMGYTSAFQISKMPMNDFAQTLSGKIGFDDAAAFHAKAVAVTEATTFLHLQMRELVKAVNPHALGIALKKDVEVILPNWENLFGQIETCECEHCRSVYSPAAYFVDLLHILLGQYDGKARKEIFRRRPDLKYTKLSCEHTDTLIPYIDLVNEILETYVTQQTIGDPASDLYASTATNDSSLLSEDELASNPQHPNSFSQSDADKAYQTLSEKVYPLNLPFDLSLETARQFLLEQNSSRFELMKTFGDADSDAFHAEGLGLSVFEYQILASKKDAGLPGEKDWKVDDLYGNAAANLKTVRAFLDATNISYIDLIALIKTQFLDADQNIILALNAAPANLSTAEKKAWEVANACNFNETFLIHADLSLLTDAELIRINRFIRLWKKLGCSIEELDILITAADTIPGKIFTIELLNNLSKLWQYKLRQNISAEQASTLINNIPTHAENSLYQRLFLNKAILQIDPLFELDATKSEIAIQNEWIGKHIPALLAAFQLKENELNDIANLLDLDIKDPNASIPYNALSLSNISLIYRVLVFAKINGIKIHDLFLLKALLPKVKWNNVNDLVENQAFIDKIKIHDLKASVLAYLFANFVEQGDTLPPKPEVIKQAGENLTKGLKELDDSLNVNKDTITADFLRRQLISIVREEDADKIIEICVPSKTLPEENLPPIEQTDFNTLLYPKPIIDTDEYKNILKNYISQADINTISQKVKPAERLFEYWVNIKNEWTSHSRPAFIKKHLVTQFKLDAGIIDFVFPFIEPIIETQYVDVYNQLFKFLWLVKKFNLESKELVYFQTNSNEFSGFVWNNFSITQLPSWLRVADYCQLRNSLPKSDTSLITVFEAPQNSTDITKAIIAATSYSAENVSEFVINNSGGNFKNEKLLIRLQKQISISEVVGVDIAKLTPWGELILDPSIAQQIKHTLKAKFDESSWVQVSTKVHNALRNQQRDALVAFLLNNDSVTKELKALKKSDSVSVNDLYSYFLIDVEMDAVMKTSRLKQAISSVQLFTQRCIMNLESQKSNPANNIAPTDIDAKQWSWMKLYRVWEANRKVFLYPENWIEPELRDGKSPFFKELESELLQGEVTTESVETAIQNYLYKLDDVARLDICGTYEDTDAKELHVFGRTFNVPLIYYYRKLNLNKHEWTPWEKVQLDIQGNEEGANPGVHLIPVVWNRRLYLFWPIFTERFEKATDYQKLNNLEPDRYWKIKLAWSELNENKWSVKKVSSHWIESLLSRTYIWSEANMSYFKKDIEFKNSRIDLHKFFCFISTNNQLFIEVKRLQIIENEIWLQENPKIKYDQWFVNPTGKYHKTYETRFEKIGYFLFNACNSKAEANTISSFIGINDPEIIQGSVLDYQKYLLLNNNKQLILEKSKPKLLLKNIVTTNGRLLKSNVHPDNQFYKFFFQDNIRNYYVEPQDGLFSEGLHDGNLITIPALKTTKLTLIKPKKSNEPISQNRLETIQMVLPEQISDLFEKGEINATSFKILKTYQETPRQLERMTILPSKAGMIGNYYLERYVTRLDFKPFFHAYVCSFIKAITKAGIDGLLNLSNQMFSDLKYVGGLYSGRATNNFKEQYQPMPENVCRPYPYEEVDFNPTGAYSMYNWELFFHIPLLLANRLSKNQKFEEAMRWYHFIFDPTTNDPERLAKRYWQVVPLRNAPTETLEALLQHLNKPQGNPRRKELENAIDAWRDNPFNPHLIARLRLVAYQKNVLMKYLDNLLAWADNLFRQDTIEQINQATQLYIMAAELLGKRPEKIPVRGKIPAHNYDELKAGLNAFSNAQVQMETMFPFYNLENIQTNDGGTTAILSTTVPADYFCLPENPKLLAYWDTVADRLFKIRHSLNIEGVGRQLALYEPPIDPALLVQAYAQGIDINSILADLNAPLPYYRFGYIVQKALEICSELKSLGNTLLSVLEKKDNEALSMMRTEHEKILLYLSKTVRKLQITESQLNRDGLEKTLEVTNTKINYYTELISTNLMPEENEQSKKLKLAIERQDDAAMFEIAASIAHNFPSYTLGALTQTWSLGGPNIGFGLNAWARSINNLASGHTFEANTSATNASNQRRLNEWVFQKELAEKELKQIDKQILAAKFRENIAEQELTNLEQQLDNSSQVLDFMRNKYTQEELYGWMQGEISTIYFQCYQLAYDLAKKAEKTYRHELGIETSNFIQFGIWDSFRKGLMSGEKLYLSLKQLEKAYMDQNRREYEITKHISIAQLDPLTLIRLREKGICDFEIPEAFYDMDHPGHYFRRIKSVSISIPCIAGPYTSVSSKLTLLKSKYRKNTNAQIPYPEKSGNDDDRFVYNLGALQSIATSNAQNDSGMFELNFRDERYLPFEYAGAISTWRLELPIKYKQFDYHTISDVVLHIKYTAREGGAGLKTLANEKLNEQLDVIKQGIKDESGLHIAVNMKHDMPNEWYLLKKKGVIDLTIDKSRLPYMVKPLNPLIDSIMFIAKVIGNANTFNIKAARQDIPLIEDSSLQLYKSKTPSPTGFYLDTPFELFVVDIQNLEELILVVKYKF